MGSRWRRNGRLRRLGALLSTAVVTLAAAALAHAATFTSSAITSPASGSVLFYDADQGAGSVTVSGSVDPAAAGSGDLLCYTSSSTYTVATGVTVPASGAFAATVSLSAISGQACRLRLVPAGTKPSNTAAAPFTGPVVSVSYQHSHATGGVLYGYDLLGGNASFAYELGSLGECPVLSSSLTDLSSLSFYFLFYGNACLLQSSGIPPYTSSRSAIQIDGLNAYPPAAISKLSGLGGFIPLSYSATWTSDHSSVAVTEADSLVYCSSPGGYPPSASTGNCPSVTAAGIVVHQTTTLTDGGQLAHVTQQFVDVDHTQHHLDLLFSQAIRAPASGQLPGFEFPGQSVFASHGLDDTFALFPQGPGTIYVSANSADAPGVSNPIGAITYGPRPPSDAHFVTAVGSQTAKFVMHYTTVLPANGSITYDWSFAQADDAQGLEPLVTSARDAFFTPKLKLLRPRSKSVVRSSRVLVSGIAMDQIGVEGVSVNGQVLTPDQSGRFSTEVALRPGINRLVVTATNLGGSTTQTTIIVDYRPRPCIVPKLRGQTVTRARSSLITHGCTLGGIRMRRSRTVARGHVISSNPPHGRHRPGAKVTLTISAGRR
jgi:glucodextranase-like protein/PASTA domain-containing protein